MNLLYNWRGGRLTAFIKSVFPLSLYGTYSIVWSLAIEGCFFLLISSTHWLIDMHTLVRLLTVLLTLFYLRIIDEQKDVEYDRIYNPDRPLVKGTISVAELRVIMILVIITIMSLNLYQNLLVNVVLMIDITYAFLLMIWEKNDPWIRTSLLTNLVVTYPVQLLLSIYQVFSLASSEKIFPQAGQITLLIVAFTCAFLHFEFARKTAWSADSESRLYSVRLGPKGSASVTFLLAVIAVLLIFVLFFSRAGWWCLLILIAFTFSLFGYWKFMFCHTLYWPRLSAQLFLLFFYVILILLAFVTIFIL